MMHSSSLTPSKHNLFQSPGSAYLSRNSHGFHPSRRSCCQPWNHTERKLYFGIRGPAGSKQGQESELAFLLTNRPFENQSSHPGLLIPNQMAPRSSKPGPWGWNEWLSVGKGREVGGLCVRFINSFLSASLPLHFSSQGDLHKSHHERTFIIIIIIVIILGCVLTDASECVTCYFSCVPNSQCLGAKNILLSNYSPLFS